ncbi:MAG: hypothetical protein ACLP01_25290 [Solirubrobacteraceae bacterium]
MPTQQTIEPVLSPELEALAHAADHRLRAELDGTDNEISGRQQAVTQAANAAITAGLPLSAVAQAEQIGQARARSELGSDLLRRVERTARRSREAAAEYEQAIARAARLGLSHRDIAAVAQIAHGTIRAILARTERHPSPDRATARPHDQAGQVDSGDTPENAC